MKNIKQPKYSKLPYSIHNGDYLDILDAEDCIVATVNTHLNDKADSEYIVQACNNFPKAVELLKKSEFYLSSFVEDKVAEEIREFLKSLENE